MAKHTGTRKGEVGDSRPTTAPTDETRGDLVSKVRLLERKLKRAELLLDFSRRVAGLESLDDVFATIVELTTRVIGGERGSLFLSDPVTGELYSRFAQGNVSREIRVFNDSGIAGAVFQTGKVLVSHDAYSDPRFNPRVDEQTGYETRSVLGAPIKTASGIIIGVVEVLNKKEGGFDEEDAGLLEEIIAQAVAALQSRQFFEKIEKSREQEFGFLRLVGDVTSELDLGALLAKVMREATSMLQADRGTLFLNDDKSGELFSRVAMGDRIGEIRLPNTEGIAGAVFQSGRSVNIPHAYADLRFNPRLDKQTGYFTRSILCVPVVNKTGKVIGVTQVLNKRGGGFTGEDEARLTAFTSQIAIALENAKLFEDVQNMKSYNESMLQSMSNGVVTFDEEGRIVTCNAAALRILRCREEDIIGRKGEDHFVGRNAWVMDRGLEVAETGEAKIVIDAELEVGSQERPERTSVNLNALPLLGPENQRLGLLLMIEDISKEKRMRSTMSRYIDPGLTDQLLAGGDSALGGRSVEATILFSDIRSFTTLAERLGPQDTVRLLNEYFSIMVECISSEGGMLDKFIGDSIMAGFGVPMSHEDDADRALRAAVAMIRELWEWNRRRRAEGHDPIEMGIGLNTDNVVTGNIGSLKRMDYTMIGDGVNLAARLESACKRYAARILISELTYRKLKGTYRIRHIDRVLVGGRRRPVEIYEVLDFHTEDSFPNLMEGLNNFKAARECYNRGEWQRATTLFQECLKANPNDKLAQIYIERCELLKAQPPAAWDGIFVIPAS